MNWLKGLDLKALGVIFVTSGMYLKQSPLLTGDRNVSG